MTLRKLIIKHFWGLYRVKLPIPSFRPFGIRMQWTSAVRASRIIFPTLLTAGILIVIQGYWGVGTWLALISTPLFFFLGFAWKYSYFDLFPPKWEELDREQRWDLGFMSITIARFPYTMTAEEFAEWEKLDAYFKAKLSS